MPLSIVAAKDIGQAIDILTTGSGRAGKHYVAEEPNGIDKFLYNCRNEFSYYGWYYRFDPYRETYLEPNRVPIIKNFSDSIGEWIADHGAEEHIVIRKYSLSFQKIRDFADKLNRVCETAMENGYGLVGIGD